MKNAGVAGELVKWVLGIVTASLVVLLGNYFDIGNRQDDAVANSLLRLDAKMNTVVKKQSEMQSKQAGMQKDIGWITQSVGDIYTKTEAQKEHDKIYRTDKDQYSRISDLNARVRVLESRDSR